ncbi:SNAP receptor, partial [Coelomomyces lativittatus]
TENQLRDAKGKIKLLVQKFSPQAEPRGTIENGPLDFHYLLENAICYLSICDHTYPRKLAFDFLSELAKEFYNIHGPEVPQANRAYQFIKFDTHIQKLKKQYLDSRNTNNLQRLNEDLQDVTRIITKNMEDLLFRGDSLDRMSSMSDRLRDSSLKYRKDARRLRLEALYRKYGPFAAIFLVVLVFLYVKFFY